MDTPSAHHHRFGTKSSLGQGRVPGDMQQRYAIAGILGDLTLADRAKAVLGKLDDEKRQPGLVDDFLAAANDTSARSAHPCLDTGLTPQMPQEVIRHLTNRIRHEHEPEIGTPDQAIELGQANARKILP